MKIEAKMRELGLRFPPLGAPGGLYAFARRTGNLVYVSGQTPDLGGVLQIKGVVGKDIDIPTAQKAAELAALNILAVLKVELGDLDRITQFVRIWTIGAKTPWMRDALQAAPAAAGFPAA